MICTFESKRKAIPLSSLAGLTGVFAAAVANSLYVFNGDITSFLIRFAAGFSIHLAASKMIPDSHNEERYGKSVLQLIVSVCGITLIWFLGILVLNERIDSL